MKKTLISVFEITSLVTVSLVALKCRLKPPKKEVFNFDEPLEEDGQEVLMEIESQEKLRKVAKAWELLMQKIINFIQHTVTGSIALCLNARLTV